MSNKTAPWILLAGDLFAVLLFVFIGQRDHNTLDTARPLPGLLRAAFPFLLVWVVVVWPTRAVSWKGTEMGLPILLARAINAWLIAAPLALMLRAFILGGRTIPPTFMLVTLALGGAFVLAWRILFWLLWQKVGR
jgi:hypothetical protein